MDIWVDADACPVLIKKILYRAAKRTGTLVTLVANQPFRIPKSSFIKFLVVGSGIDVADNEIVKRVKADDADAAPALEIGDNAFQAAGQVL